MNKLNKRINTQTERVNTEVLIEDWRFRFKNAMSQFSVRGEAFNVLCEKDSYFSTKDGVYDWANIRNYRAGIVSTSRAVLILERYLSEKKNQKSYLRKIKHTS